MEELLHYVSELTAENFVDVPLAHGVDRDALVAGDDDPLFVTLPIGEIGAISANGKEFPREAMLQLVQTVNENRPGGIVGHMKPEERASRFDLPSLMWVGAMEHGGLIYGKAYIPKYASAVREYVKKSKARRAKIATSIYGTAVMDGRRVKRLNLESIDLADPARAAVGAAIAHPILTSEMVKDSEEEIVEDEKLIAELKGQRDELKAKVQALEGDLKAENIAEMRRSAGLISELRSIVGEDVNLVSLISEMKAERDSLQKIVGEGSVLARVQEMQTQIAELAAAQLEADIIAEMDEAKVPDALRDYARVKLGVVADKATAKAQIAELVGSESYQALAKAIVVSEQGGSVMVGARLNGGHGTAKVDVSPEAMAKSRAEFSVPI